MTPKEMCCFLRGKVKTIRKKKFNDQLFIYLFYMYLVGYNKQKIKFYLLKNLTFTFSAAKEAYFISTSQVITLPIINF